ncbi:GAF domain-containing protein [Aliiglaciecola sp. CAU 1673]|uniref:GAF domain-containing protein n=1 Tax=Aliiglaciecola sp. CAU 1673 TaxID=3032595 RepID=UPI0023DCE3D4|nr:GAF domain-containing protein [Aliiglaciecola sp. CAU 1673]MDF2177845.1 GAF domain-containing protein [Aliiglaciecola sp. CAU 1673]
MNAASEDTVLLLNKQQLLAIIQAQSRIIGQNLKLDQVMNKMAELAQDLTYADGAVVELEEGDQMVYRAATGKATEQLGMRLNKSTSLSGLCLKENKVLYCEDADSDPRVDKQACARVGLRSMLVVPLQHEQQCFGVLKVFSPKEKAFDDVDVQVLNMVAHVVAAAINASLTQQQGLAE